ncbi:YsnF/AvaK domain-containing protein [Altererythrobacter sp. SALINAS58]|uniref:YsnF/AvaK domain-containing protein n=1 Tax=Alteripontixanthobacter muriae TaxID=2705546 RepID=UPI00157536D8|nr:YsnF/AvaK domain-containing protein [Alteripontixanthobacter muriae]NTZ43677.1 YsnF/AvaK domain-containing protein [Alteripontixanthobacter muriae]
MRHDSRYDDLDTLDHYELEHKSQDIRGRPLVSPEGKKFGIIKDLLVDKSHNRVTAIRLDDGRACAVEPLVIHDNSVVYGEAAVAHAKTGGSAVSEEVVPVVEEQVAIGKRVADHGRDITVTSHVVKDKVSEDVHLRDEHVSVDKRPVNRDVTGKEADALLKGKTVSMTERDEEVVVGKKAVVTDEVVVKKTADDRVEHVDETVRRTEVDVDRDGKTRR